jgi:NADH-quinone oxidoreductase subunit F
MVATGRWVGRTLGPSTPQVETAVKFLWDVKLGERTSAPARVVVIGGGAVAMDAAMSALRLGAETTLVALEQRDDMLVPEEELHEALEDGVQVLNGWSTKDFVEPDGQLRKLVKLVLQRCLRVFDDDYRFAPQFDGNELREIEADLVVTAVGQEADMGYLDEDIGLDERRNIILDSAFRTSAEGVFAAGDVKAPGLIISAVGEGKRAAMSIDSYLGGSGIYFGRTIEVPETRLDPRIWDFPREQAVKLEPAKRRQGFAEVESTFSRDQAHREANRCMRCDRNSTQALYLRTFPEGTS